MKPQKHYIQVWIESEDDLPEKLQKVFVHWTDNMSTSLGTILQEREICRKRDTVLGIDWYLAEVEQPKGLTDEEIEKEALNHCAYQGQPERTDEKIKKALENLIFTAGKLWDEVKPIKDTEIRAVTHPIIEEAKIVLASLTLQAQQPSDDNIEKWMDTEYPLYKYPKSRKERKVNTMTCLVRDGIRYSLKAMRDGKIPLDIVKELGWEFAIPSGGGECDDGNVHGMIIGEDSYINFILKHLD